MSRVYRGRFCCLLVWRVGSSEVYGSSAPSTYEACEELLYLIGQGVQYEGQTITRALIVPVSE